MFVRKRIKFTINEVGRETRSNFLLEEVLYDVVFDNFTETFEEAEVLVSNMLADFVERFTALMAADDKISVTFFHNMFHLPIVIPFVRKEDFTRDLLENYFFTVIQSYRYTIISDTNSLEAKVQIVRIPRGSGRRKLAEWEKLPRKKYYSRKTDFVAKLKTEKPKTRVKRLKRKEKVYIPVAQRLNKEIKFSYIQKRLNKMTSVTQIFNNDHTCALRAILFGKAKIDFKLKKIKKMPTTCQMNKKVKDVCKNRK